MVTMILGLLYWLARISFTDAFLTFLIQLDVIRVHQVLGFTGVLGLFVLGVIAAFTQGLRLLGLGSMVYALLVPAFGLAHALILVGSLHWLIQVAHLLLGIGTMFLAREVGVRYKLAKRSL